MGRIVKRVAIISVASLGVLIFAGVLAKWTWDARFYNGYSADIPLNAVVRADEEREGYRRIDVTFDGLADQPVPTLIAKPQDSSGPLPVAIFLHGIGQDKDFLDDIAKPFVEAGYLLVTYDQYTRGERKLKDASPLDEMLALRRRAALNVIETRRLVDYLLTRGDVDPDRIYLLGASFGAITGSTAAAFEPRISATVLCYGGGNIRRLFSSEISREEAGENFFLLREAACFFLAPADPLRHVDEIAPRPLLFQHGRGDRWVPAECAQELFDAAGEPKEFIWYDSDHIGFDPDHVMVVIREAIAWMDKQGGAEG